MKKPGFLFISLIILSAFVLASCSGTDAAEVQVGGEGEVVKPQPQEDLPAIPSVEFGPGHAWFRATDPSEIQLAAGKVQVFKFSASW